MDLFLPVPRARRNVRCWAPSRTGKRATRCFTYAARIEAAQARVGTVRTARPNDQCAASDAQWKLCRRAKNVSNSCRRNPHLRSPRFPNLRNSTPHWDAAVVRASWGLEVRV